ncbi:MAG: NAD(+)/NADH kinase [Acidimicrobiales bacterium]
MTTVALLVHPTRPEAARLAGEAVTWLEARGHVARLLSVPGFAPEAGGVSGGPESSDLAGSDLAVSLGGDGTFLRLVPLAYRAGVPVLGVNFGRLGYLLEVAPDRFLASLARAVAGDVAIEERTVISVSVDGGLTDAATGDRSATVRADGGRQWVALNEMVVEKTVPGHMVALATTIDGEPAFTYQADGVLVATPTGSTAYNLSAGGPILSPRFAAMILTPVAPHLSIDRSLVLHPDQVVTVAVGKARPAVLVIDGREIGELCPGAEVVCQVAPTPLRVVTLGERGFAGLLRSTLAPGRDD